MLAWLLPPKIRGATPKCFWPTCSGGIRQHCLPIPSACSPRRKQISLRACSGAAWPAKPIQYLTGAQEFFGLLFEVSPDVLIPRPETEHLVEAVLERFGREANPRIVDVGTGSGAIAVALAHALPRSQVTAVDLFSAALEVARRNAQRHGVIERVTLLQSDLLAAIDSADFDAVVSNPPYIADGEVLEPQVVQLRAPLRALRRAHRPGSL